MREILFRGKDIKGNWYEGLLTHNIAKDEWYISNKAGIPTAYQVRPETLGQYTGLTDKNGIRIFEGDIIKVDDDFDTFGKMAGEIREVWFKDGGFRLKPKYPSTIARGDRGYWMEDGADFEVIGNVWDNPELLGGDSDG